MKYRFGAWLALLMTGLAARAHAAQGDSAPDDEARPVIVVTASRADLTGRAQTASEGSITREEVALRPIYRPGQLFESIPGLVVTIHSGEGKAQQYLIRGYNLDHGTDFASFVDDVPVNRPTNAHGQGYSDLNFLIPQVVAGIDYTKGPYYAAIGDFGSVASAHTRLLDTLPSTVAATIGSDGYQSVFAGTTVAFSGGGRVLGAVGLDHYDGPWQPGQNFRKVNAMLRYSRGSAHDRLTITAMAYASAGRLVTDQPERAIEQGLVGRYGTLDPTDSSRSQRFSLAGHLDKPLGAGQFSLAVHVVRSTMTLWNNFTHYLDDPVLGDQEEQDERRTLIGGFAQFAFSPRLFGLSTTVLGGVQLRHDTVFVDRRHTWHRDTVLGTCHQETDAGPMAYPAVGGNCTADQVDLLMVSPWAEATVHWTPWLRTTLGVRADHLHAGDRNLARAGAAAPARASGGQWLAQPKANLALGPWHGTELYASWGRGFHSNDVRGVFGFDAGGNSAGTRLLSQTTGIEAGLRATPVPRLTLQLAVFRQDFSSELTYNADVGADDATAPSRRRGIELSALYRPFGWLELNTDLAFSDPRYRCAGNGTGANGCDAIAGGTRIADAPEFIMSAGVLVNGAGPWSGSVQWRRLGPHALTDGPPVPRDGGYAEWNLEAGYELRTGLLRGWKAQVGIFNLFNSRSQAADYYYTTRLPGEPADGVAGFQSHPLEPRSARITIGKSW